MNTTKSNSPSPEGQKQLETLRQAVDKTLEKKRRLGQYAVTWKDGKPVIAGEDAPEGVPGSDHRFSRGSNGLQH